MGGDQHVMKNMPTHYRRRGSPGPSIWESNVLTLVGDVNLKESCYSHRGCDYAI